MRVAGIAVKMAKKDRPAVRMVVLSDDPTVSVESCVEFTSTHTALPEQLHDAAEAIRSRLAGLSVDRVIVRRADHSPVSSSKPGPQIRLLAEGAVVSAARSVVVDTRLVTGQEAGRLHGSSKVVLDDQALTFATAQHVNATLYTEAVAAGLAGLAI